MIDGGPNAKEGEMKVKNLRTLYDPRIQHYTRKKGEEGTMD
jgi:hypothetical protein